MDWLCSDPQAPTVLGGAAESERSFDPRIVVPADVRVQGRNKFLDGRREPVPREEHLGLQPTEDAFECSVVANTLYPRGQAPALLRMPSETVVLPEPVLQPRRRGLREQEAAGQHAADRLDRRRQDHAGDVPPHARTEAEPWASAAAVRLRSQLRDHPRALGGTYFTLAAGKPTDCNPRLLVSGDIGNDSCERPARFVAQLHDMVLSIDKDQIGLVLVDLIVSKLSERSNDDQIPNTCPPSSGAIQ